MVYRMSLFQMHRQGGDGRGVGVGERGDVRPQLRQALSHLPRDHVQRGTGQIAHSTAALK